MYRLKVIIMKTREKTLGITYEFRKPSKRHGLNLLFSYERGLKSEIPLLCPKIYSS